MSNKTASKQGKKKLTRNILIGVLVALVIAVVIFLSVALQKDSAGMNCFQRKATVATTDGEKVSMSEYRMMFDSQTQLYKYYGISISSMLTAIQEDAAQQALLQKIYVKEGKALGITLTKEEQDTCKKNAQEYIDNTENQYKEYMVSQGTYSKSAYEKQLAEYYNSVGMNRNELYEYARQSEEASLFYQKLYERVTNENTLEGDALTAYYRETAEKAMSTEYEAGQFWTKLDGFRASGSTPMLYLPEGFILIDFAELEFATVEEAEQLAEEVKAGTRSFDELMASEDNKDPFYGKVQGPYPIAANDHAELFKDDEVYNRAEALGFGEVDYYIAQIESDDAENKTVTLYLFRRAEGTICMDGESGVINLDWFVGFSDTLQKQYINEKWTAMEDQWLSDVKLEDAIYTYDGGLS